MRKFFRYLFITLVVFGLVSAGLGTAFGFYLYHRFTKDLPKIEKISDYRPQAVTHVYAKDGTLIAEFYEKRRYPVKLDEIPPLVRKAFLAAEDANFYTHPGIDLTSIFRALWKNLQRKQTVQGASTITQQIVKSLLLSREKTYERKAREAILSYRLEKALSKDEILNVYLNEIFLGANAYGVRAASRTHFRKEMDQLTLAEAAYLAGLPKSPSYLTSLRHRPEAIGRQHYVLAQMEKNGMINPAEAEAARAQEIVTYPADVRNIFHAPYFVSHIKLVLDEKLKALNPKWSDADPGGFEVHTTVDLRATEYAEAAMTKGLRELDKRRGWRGSVDQVSKENVKSIMALAAERTKNGLARNLIYRAIVKSVDVRSGVANVVIGDYQGTVNLKEAGWAKRFLDSHDRAYGGDPVTTIKAGSVIEVSLFEPPVAADKSATEKKELANPEKKTDLRFVLDQTPDIEGAFAVLNTRTGEVASILGGYDYGRSVFNRATQGLRQPGSSFKPFIYLAALDYLHFTPSTIVPDSPISLIAGNGQLWTPGNFDGKFLGPITLRTALQRSRNVVSVYMLTKLGIQRGIDSARKLGITTPIGRDLSISLGSAEVKLIEMVRAYGTFANEGYLADPIVVRTIKDRDGRVLSEQFPHQHQAISEESAFIMANMMKGVVDRGTATIVKKLGKPTAGKTGTTNDQMDAWFLGYTPEWSAGVWVGFDQKKTIGKMETGGKAAAPIFLYFMQDFLADEPPLDFVPPDGVVPALVNLNSGRPTVSSDPEAFIEYFKAGTEPNPEEAAHDDLPQDYLSSDEF